MKLRSLLPVLFGLFIIVACKNESNQDDTPETRERQENYRSEENKTDEDHTTPSSRDQNRSASGEDTSPDDSVKNEPEMDRAVSNTSQLSEGIYVKEGEKDANCECYCVDLTFTGTTELCLKEGTIFITARMSRGENGAVNIFLVEPAARNTEGEDIPWEEFDSNVPIATISNENGKMDLDWLGFTINGDLAMDYAIYGKKTLEGTYKKK
jgi:zinc D-Ala-D-Ala carboxypeptidase